MNDFKRFALCCCLLPLLACQSTPQANLPTWQPQPMASLYADNVFAEQSVVIETKQQIFELPETARREINKVIDKKKGNREKTNDVLKYLFSFADQELMYSNSATTVATETLANGQANCLSLSIVAYALAREVGLNVEFQDVMIPEYWTNQHGQSVLNGHVNVRVLGGISLGADSVVSFDSSNVIIDFDPFSNKKQFSSYVITSDRVVAMFYNNKGAQAFIENRVDDAYWYFKAATEIDSDYSASWANLAVLYKQSKLYDFALRAYEHSLWLQPDSTNTMANLAVLYRITGEGGLAKTLESEVNRHRDGNPFYHVMLGNEALNRLDFAGAGKHFLRATELNPQTHEAWFGLAKAALAQEKMDKASYYLRQAQIHAPFSSDKKRYRSKLDALNAMVN